ncbi:hypothetical protein [Shewanella sp.]|uniref:hypothetical protein n=1 Tax=Shewanella sp. TaxID=50422 RepID=UPI0040474388
MKYYDTFLNASAITATTTWAGSELDPATILTLCAPVKGTGINNRIGREVNVHKIKIRGMVNVPSQVDQTAKDAAFYARLILVMDTQTNAAQMAGESLMANPGAATANLTVNTFQNLDSLGRYRVLKDKNFTLQNPATSWDGTNIEQNGLVRPFKWTHTFKTPIKVRFNEANNGDIGDIVDNSFHIIGTIAAAGLAPTLSYQCRVSYKG